MTTFGWDASHYDAVPDGARVVAEGFKFMTHKAGGDTADGDLSAWWRAMKPHRGDILLGAYWVLYPGSPASRADTFLARLDSQCPGWRDGPFILQADCEQWNGDSSTMPGKTDIRAFCDRLVSVMPKLRPIVYAPKWAYGNTLAGLSYPLWASAYVNGAGAASQLYPGDTSSRWDAYSGQAPAILQFTSSATIAGQTTCDANAYRGTLAELIALVAPGWAVPDMQLTDVVYNAQANNAANIPPGPRTLGDILGALDQRTGYLANKLVPDLPTASENARAVLAALPTTSVDPSAVASELIKSGITLEIAQALVSLLTVTPA